MKLTWGQRPYDADSHLLTPNGTHIYYAAKGSLADMPYANLDVDDTSSFGPEIITIRRLMVGTYRYGVFNYSGDDEVGLTASPVHVLLEGAKVQERAITPGAGEGSNYFWHAFNLIVDAQCNVTYESVNTWLPSSSNFAALASTDTDAVYCEE